jgi:hypothetical protein
MKGKKKKKKKKKIGQKTCLRLGIIFSGVEVFSYPPPSPFKKKKKKKIEERWGGYQGGQAEVLLRRTSV